MKKVTVLRRMAKLCLTVSMASGIALITSSCVFSRLKKDVQTTENQWRLIATVDAKVFPSGDLVAVVYTPYTDAQRVAAFKVVDPAIKRVTFLLDPSVYRLLLFQDKNRNLTLDEGEPHHFANKGNRLRFSDVMKNIDIELSLPDERGALPKGYPRELASLPDSVQSAYHRSVGDLMNLDDRKFSQQAGKMGLWEPTRFLKEHGAGIYMLEEYVPSKVPVLFINGAGGSAQNWRYFFERLDKTKFQAWFILYPSGMRIKRIGKGINLLIRDMQRKFGNTRLHVVAHSMGGLVGRETIVNHITDGEPPIIDKYITIATPWNGHRLAKKGVSSMFTAVPSWHDVVPGSNFLQTAFSFSLKDKVDHHLIFAYLDSSGDDGTVDLSSVLLEEAQNDAVEVRAFQADHVGVLSLDLVFEYVENIMSSTEADTSQSEDERSKEGEGIDSAEEDESPSVVNKEPENGASKEVSP